MIRDRLRQLLRRRVGAVFKGQEGWAPEPTAGLGHPRLSDGVVLERSALIGVEDLVAALRRPGRLTLVHHWATWAPAVEGDVPILLELHLSWAQYVDFIGVGWELMSGRQVLDEAALEVDAFHRDFGLTWRTLVVQGGRDALREAVQLRSEVLPQTWVRDRDGRVIYLQEGALDEDAGRQIEAAIRGATGVVDRPRPGFG